MQYFHHSARVRYKIIFEAFRSPLCLDLAMLVWGWLCVRHRIKKGPLNWDQYLEAEHTNPNLCCAELEPSIAVTGLGEQGLSDPQKTQGFLSHSIPSHFFSPYPQPLENTQPETNSPMCSRTFFASRGSCHRSRHPSRR